MRKQMVYGVDLGWATQLETMGYRWLNEAGEETDLLKALKEFGVNAVRFRVFVNPPEGAFWQRAVTDFKPDTKPLLIYECHIGMAQNREGVGTYDEFRENVLPRIAKDGYNAIQIMAIQEHPYYGSFGYHVSSFYAPSSRFGTPDQLRRLIDAAHAEGIAVIMDIVHSHAVKNENEV